MERYSAEQIIAAMTTDSRTAMITDALGRRSIGSLTSEVDQSGRLAVQMVSKVSKTQAEVDDFEKDIERLDQSWRPWRRHKRAIPDLIEQGIRLHDALDTAVAVLESSLTLIAPAQLSVAADAQLTSEIGLALKDDPAATDLIDRAQRILETALVGEQGASSLRLVADQSARTAQAVRDAVLALVRRAEALGLALPPKTQEWVLATDQIARLKQVST